MLSVCGRQRTVAPLAAVRAIGFVGVKAEVRVSPNHIGTVNWRRGGLGEAESRTRHKLHSGLEKLRTTFTLGIGDSESGGTRVWVRR